MISDKTTRSNYGYISLLGRAQAEGPESNAAKAVDAIERVRQENGDHAAAEAELVLAAQLDGTESEAALSLFVLDQMRRAGEPVYVMAVVNKTPTAPARVVLHHRDRGINFEVMERKKSGFFSAVLLGDSGTMLIEPTGKILNLVVYDLEKSPLQIEIDSEMRLLKKLVRISLWGIAAISAGVIIYRLMPASFWSLV